MEEVNSPVAGIPESNLDFSIGFNNTKFSDRILLLEIIDGPDHEPDPEILPPPPQPVKTIHICSLILAARSPFFLKLFTNGMRESEERHATIRIKASEETPFMDLLNYIYSNKLPTCQFALLDLLEIADKFEVASCSSSCIQSLLNLPMTCESASYFLDLPQNPTTPSTLQPLIDAAKQFIVEYFTDVDELKNEVVNLPLAGIKAVLSNDDLRVCSEFAVYELALMWARRNYPDLEERREILQTHLLHLIRFPLMDASKLVREVLNCSDINRRVSLLIVHNALYFKAETPLKQLRTARKHDNAASQQYTPRAYTRLPIKVVEFETPHQQCLAYFDIKQKELFSIFPSGQITSQGFSLGEQWMAMVGSCCFYEGSNSHYFKLSLVMDVAKVAATYEIDLEFATRLKPSEEFVCWYRASYKFVATQQKYTFSCCTPWDAFLYHHNQQFINGVLHLSLKLTIKITDV